jgi:hypothetical protein
VNFRCSRVGAVEGHGHNGSDSDPRKRGKCYDPYGSPRKRGRKTNRAIQWSENTSLFQNRTRNQRSPYLFHIRADLLPNDRPNSFQSPITLQALLPTSSRLNSRLHYLRLAGVSPGCSEHSNAASTVSVDGDSTSVPSCAWLPHYNLSWYSSVSAAINSRVAGQVLQRPRRKLPAPPGHGDHCWGRGCGVTSGVPVARGALPRRSRSLPVRMVFGLISF